MTAGSDVARRHRERPSDWSGSARSDAPGTASEAATPAASLKRLGREWFGDAAVAAVALLIVIHLSAFTGVELTTQFAFLVVVTTIAVGTVWAGARGLVDVYLASPDVRIEVYLRS